MEKYTVKDFQRDFPDDAACLEWLKVRRFGERLTCRNCGRDARNYRIKARKVYGCEYCGHQISPTANTIFHASSTPLTTWFYTIYLMAQTRGGISAKQIERETGVTYKTAWRMCREIRKMLAEDQPPMSGDVEVDESYFGGRRRGPGGRGARGKTPVLGIAERKSGTIEVKTLPNVKADTVMPIIHREIEYGAQIHTDEYPVYNSLAYRGFRHSKVLHSMKVYVLGNAHTNTVDGFWALVKNGIKGVYHSVSPKYLQRYLNEYAFRYNHRKDRQPMFWSFLHRSH